MKSTRVVSFRSEHKLVEQLDSLAKLTERDRQYHIKLALNQYLDAYAAQFQPIGEQPNDLQA